MKTLEAIRPRPLHDEVADRLRELITRGELAPGERLNERLLTQRFGISRTPLREAVKILSSEGLVKLLPNRGAVVTTITRADAEDMFQVMAVLEALGGELACRRASDEDIDEVRRLHEKMRGCHEAGDLVTYFELNQKIHQKIIDCAGNRELADAYRRISVRIRRGRYMANLSRPRWNEVMSEHERILDALVHRDSERLKEILALHLANKAKVIREWLASAERDGTLASGAKT
ncbi:MAG TPA: GntR family transcriptional regulator [Gammaproteobacteria bacterium]